MMAYTSFDIIEVARKCGIVFKPNQDNRVEVKARCPFCGDNKYHLGINREKERFHCFRCNERGNSITLYSKIFGITNKEAYNDLCGANTRHTPKTICFSEKIQTPIGPLTDRHNVYYDFLQLLRLNQNHQTQLMGRGLSFANLSQFMYKSIPLDDGFRREVLERLSQKHDLFGIPGFYRDENGDWQMYLKQCGGFFIPVCNAEGYIQGLQIRLDVTEEEHKFRWFSSNHYQDGTRALPWIHVVGNTLSKTACITEGALKADVTSVLSEGALFIAVPGVNAINMLSEVVKDLGITKVYEAFDMDKKNNINVKKALIALRNELSACGVEYISCSWNPIYNGIDDYYYNKNKFMAQSVA